MGILQEHIKDNCDSRLQGVLSLGVREAYQFLEKLKESEKILQRPEMKKTYGHIRNGFIDVALKQVLESSEIPHEIVDKTVSRYRNGYTYLMIETQGAILTPSKVEKTISVPPKAIFRSKGSIINKQYTLFDNSDDLNQKYDESNPPFLLLTYGGYDYKLDFVRLGLPDLDVKEWIDQVDITRSPVLLKNQNDVKRELELTFTSEAKQLIERGVDDAREEESI
ncbi:hypothetical protein ACQ7AI_11265 [Lactococcus petauri]